MIGLETLARQFVRTPSESLREELAEKGLKTAMALALHFNNKFAHCAHRFIDVEQLAVDSLVFTLEKFTIMPPDKTTSFTGLMRKFMYRKVVDSLRRENGRIRDGDTYPRIVGMQDQDLLNLIGYVEQNHAALELNSELEALNLTRREQAVVDQLLKGHDCLTVSKILGISQRTVYTHIWNIRTKAQGRAQA